MASITTLLRFLVRGGPTEKASIEVAKARELLLDTTTQELRVGDGVTPGGLPLTVGTPTADRHLANKAYVDTGLAGKQAVLDITPAGAALLSVATPSGLKIPRINVDGSVTLIDVPSGGGGGGSRGLYSGLMSEIVPSQASTGLTTWINQGAASVSDTPIGIQVLNPTTSSDDNIRGLITPAPATPYTITALLELASPFGNYPSALLGWVDVVSTKSHVVTLCGDGRSGFISPTSYASWSFSGAPTFVREGRRVWLRFTDDGTTIGVQWSISGVYWMTLYSGAKSSSHLGSSGYNRLFFGASSYGIPGVATLLSWSLE